MLDSHMAGLPRAERQRVREYYNEILLDGMETGKSEQEAVAALGDVEEIAARTVAEYEAAAPARRGKITAGKVVLWVCAAPFILSIGVPLLAAALVLYLCVWIFIACFFVVSVSLALAGICAIVGLFFILLKNPLAALLQAGAGLLCLGLSLFVFVGSVALARQYIRFTVYMKNRLSARIRKRGVRHEA